MKPVLVAAVVACAISVPTTLLLVRAAEPQPATAAQIARAVAVRDARLERSTAQLSRAVAQIASDVSALRVKLAGNVDRTLSGVFPRIQDLLLSICENTRVAGVLC
jgi:hypothetical protein